MVSETPLDRLLGRAVSFWQLLLAIIVLLFAASQLFLIPRLSAPGAPIALFVVTVLVGGVVALIHWPRVFERLPSWGKAGAYLMIIMYVVLWAATGSAVVEAWEQTPEGARQASVARALEGAEAVAREQAEAKELAANAVVNDERERDRRLYAANPIAYTHKLESCFIANSLESEVRDTIDHTQQYELVSTSSVPPTANGYNALMTFRYDKKIDGAWISTTVTRDLRIRVHGCRLESVRELKRRTNDE